MNFQIVMLLGQDGISNGAIYALLSLSILLVFSITRILLIPQGEFVSFAALTMAALESGRPVLLGWMLLALAVWALLLDLNARRRAGALSLHLADLWVPVYALAVLGLSHVPGLQGAGVIAHALLTLALVVPLGPLLYRVFFQALADAAPLVLLIVSIALHVVIVKRATIIHPHASR